MLTIYAVRILGFMVNIIFHDLILNHNRVLETDDRRKCGSLTEAGTCLNASCHTVPLRILLLFALGSKELRIWSVNYVLGKNHKI